MEIEVFKILRRRFSVGLLLATTIIFPVFNYIIARLHVRDDGPSAEQLPYDVAFGFIQFSQAFFFIPVWIVVFVGLELSNGHANRVVFAKSRKYYILSKIYYCLIICSFFTLLAIISFVIISRALALHVETLFYFQFVIQFLLAAILISAFLLGLTFLLKSPLVTYVVYVGWSTIEGLIYTFFKAVYGVKLFWLPVHLIISVYAREGDRMLQNYFNLELATLPKLALPIVFASAIILAIYYFFPKSNLKPLSD